MTAQLESARTVCVMAVRDGMYTPALSTPRHPLSGFLCTPFYVGGPSDCQEKGRKTKLKSPGLGTGFRALIRLSQSFFRIVRAPKLLRYNKVRCFVYIGSYVNILRHKDRELSIKRVETSRATTHYSLLTIHPYR